jgi:hypothetical protein
MRVPKALSHTSLRLWEQNREEFFLKYLAESRPPRMPQTPAMCVGAAFDAFVKAKLCVDLGLNSHTREELFESQVEEHNRDFAAKAGEHVFLCYIYCGAYDELLHKMNESDEEPRFEFTVERTVQGVPLIGKPDLRFRIGNTPFIGDWKVKGYCSKYSASPTKGYRMVRDGQTLDKPTRGNGKAHKLYDPFDFQGHEINRRYLDECSTTYADQMCLYGWLMGESVGDEGVVFMMEEVVCKYAGDHQQPILRIANHAARVSHDYQVSLIQRFQDAWTSIKSGRIFTDMTREENDDRIAILDAASKHMEEDSYFTEVTRVQGY